MKKYVFRGLAILLIVGSIIGIKLMGEEASSKEIELTYKTNGGVPYKWEYEIEDESIVTLSRSYILEDQNKDGRVGAPIYTNYVFKGLKEGTTTVTFRYVSITGDEIDTEEKTTFKVDKNKNISIVGLK